MAPHAAATQADTAPQADTGAAAITTHANAAADMTHGATTQHAARAAVARAANNALTVADALVVATHRLVNRLLGEARPQLALGVVAAAHALVAHGAHLRLGKVAQLAEVRGAELARAELVQQHHPRAHAQQLAQQRREAVQIVGADEQHQRRSLLDRVGKAHRHRVVEAREVNRIVRLVVVERVGIAHRPLELLGEVELHDRLVEIATRPRAHQPPEVAAGAEIGKSNIV